MFKATGSCLPYFFSYIIKHVQMWSKSKNKPKSTFNSHDKRYMCVSLYMCTFWWFPINEWSLIYNASSMLDWLQSAVTIFFLIILFDNPLK